MGKVTMEEMHKDLEEIKVELKRISSILEEEFELSDSAKSELTEARKEALSGYIDHHVVDKEFSE